MSLKSILHGIGQFFSTLWKRMQPGAKKAVDFAVNAVDNIKNFDASNGALTDIITHLIPGDADDKAVADVRAQLPEIMTSLKLVDATLGLTDPNEIVAAAVKTLQEVSGHYRVAFLNSLSMIIATVAADGKLDINDATYLLKWYYDHKDQAEVDTSIHEAPTAGPEVSEAPTDSGVTTTTTVTTTSTSEDQATDN